MSLSRFVYYSAVLGGWAAFLAWFVAEVLFLRTGRLGGTVEAVLAGALAGAAIGAALNVVSGLSNPLWRRQLGRITPGLIGGGVGGAVGGLLGAVLYGSFQNVPAALEWLPRALGWVVMGGAIGSAEGMYEASRRKIRNGLIGGCLGGLVGGLLFDPIAGSGSGMSSRATALVILGLSIGALIGLTHVVLKEAWLTVVDGFGPGRQLILTASVTVLGRGDHLPLPFLGYAAKDLESEHSEVARQPDGTYVLRDKDSRIGTRLNGERIDGPARLTDGDLIKLGTNLIRFHHHRRRAAERVGMPALGTGSGGIAPPPPPGMPAPRASSREPPTPPPLPNGPAAGDSPVQQPPAPPIPPLPSEVPLRSPPEKDASDQGAGAGRADDDRSPPRSSPRIPPPPPPPS